MNNMYVKFQVSSPSASLRHNATRRTLPCVIFGSRVGKRFKFESQRSEDALVAQLKRSDNSGHRRDKLGSLLAFLILDFDSEPTPHVIRRAVESRRCSIL